MKVDSPEAASEAVEADGKLFLVGDGHALSRLEICNAGALNKLYTTASIPNFIGSGGAEAGRVIRHCLQLNFAVENSSHLITRWR